MTRTPKSPRPEAEVTTLAVTDQVGRLAAEGMVVSVDPDDAEDMAAFEDDALDLEDALESRFDDAPAGGA